MASKMKNILFVFTLFSLIGLGCSVKQKELPAGSLLGVAIQAFSVDMGRIPTEDEGIRVLWVEPADSMGRWKGPYLDNTWGMNKLIGGVVYCKDTSALCGFRLYRKDGAKE